MTDNLNELCEVNGKHRTLQVGEETIELAPLSPGDIADAAEYLIARRTKRLIDSTIGNIDIQTQAKAIAEVQCQTVSITDLIADRMGALKLLSLSMTKAGHKASIDGMKSKLTSMPHERWTPLLCEISGITLPGDPEGNGDGQNPLGSK